MGVFFFTTVHTDDGLMPKLVIFVQQSSVIKDKESVFFLSQLTLFINTLHQDITLDKTIEINHWTMKWITMNNLLQ